MVIPWDVMVENKKSSDERLLKSINVYMGVLDEGKLSSSELSKLKTSTERLQKIYLGLSPGEAL